MSIIKTWYLGTPATLMALPAPNDAVDNPPSRGDQVTSLLSGGMSRVMLLNPKRSWNLPYLLSEYPDANLISAFYEGLFGDGPFCLIDPTTLNVLPMDVSTCGARSNAAPGWVASTGTLAVTATAPPTDAPYSGVLTWTTPTASATLQPGGTANVADITTAPPYVASEAVTVSLRVLCASSKSVSLQLCGYSATGVLTSSSTATTATVGTTFQTLTVSAAAGASALASAVYVLPRLVVGASAPASISIGGAQLEYSTAASAWARGYGSPRVNIVAPPGRNLPVFDQVNHTLALAEV